MSTKKLEMIAENASFNKDGKEINFFKYYVNLGGIKLEVAPRKDDFTAKRLIREYFKAE